MEPGEFRRSQNWVGPAGCTLNEASFVPPPPDEVMRLMGDLEKFLHDDSPIPPLVRCGLAHVQFETIHPFLDGNGRVGRLLITFWLCWKGILKRPLLYLSDYFKRNREAYYDRLQAVRADGDWEGWMRFFLEGVRTVAAEAADTARQIQAMREKHRRWLDNKKVPHGLTLLDQLFQTPMMSVIQVKNLIRRTYPVASDLVRRLEDKGLLMEITGGSRNRIYAYRPYLALLGEDPELKAKRAGSNQ